MDKIFTQPWQHRIRNSTNMIKREMYQLKCAQEKKYIYSDISVYEHWKSEKILLLIQSNKQIARQLADLKFSSNLRPYWSLFLNTSNMYRAKRVIAGWWFFLLKYSRQTVWVIRYFHLILIAGRNYGWSIWEIPSKCCIVPSLGCIEMRARR